MVDNPVECHNCLFMRREFLLVDIIKCRITASSWSSLSLLAIIALGDIQYEVM